MPQPPPGVTTFSLVCFSLSGVLLLTPSLSSSTVSWFPFLSLSFPERLRLVLFSLWPFRTASAPSFGILLSVPSIIITNNTCGRRLSSTSICIITHRNLTISRQSLETPKLLSSRSLSFQFPCPFDHDASRPLRSSVSRAYAPVPRSKLV